MRSVERGKGEGDGLPAVGGNLPKLGVDAQAAGVAAGLDQGPAEESEEGEGRDGGEEKYPLLA